jgi:hypothetical protein
MRRRSERQTTRCSGMAQARRGSRRSHAHAGNQARPYGKFATGSSRRSHAHAGNQAWFSERQICRSERRSHAHAGNQAPGSGASRIFVNQYIAAMSPIGVSCPLLAKRTHAVGVRASGMAQNPLRTCPGWPRNGATARTRTNTLPRCSGAIMAAPGVHGEAPGGARCRHPHRQAGGYGGKVETSVKWLRQYRREAGRTRTR